MSCTIITFVLVITFALAYSSAKIELNDDKHVYLRLYPKYAQLFHPTVSKLDLSEGALKDDAHLAFFFNNDEYAYINEETLTVLYTNVTHRSIIFHESPNFEKVGSRFIYRRDLADSEGVEIELVNVEDRLFREVRRPDRTFYLTSFDNIQYLSKKPILPYYEISFICDNSARRDSDLPLPLLSYVDESFSWKPRYVIEAYSSESREESLMHSYADIHNNGNHAIIVAGSEFVADSVKLIRQIDEPRGSSEDAVEITIDEDFTGSYVYYAASKAPFSLRPRSTKSVQFLNPSVTIEPHRFYLNEFQPVNITGYLLYAYNITAHDQIIPSGDALFYSEGRFLGQARLPDIEADDNHFVTFGYDSSFPYTRTVSSSQVDTSNKTIDYHVEYTFHRTASDTNTVVHYVEVLQSLGEFELRTNSTKDACEDQMIYVQDLALHQFFKIPRSTNHCTVRFDLVVQKKQ
ncbi:unnamed protein product [Adineta ricciae]|uniref:Uncharacterized protein n=1 Tax=Adineta ricciae TaxID=249248 RepID=A0A814XE08_ADIRI|nr:unnamed protein product [Adineta ricciae]CAF1213735.1 unnamed protein product [Adineta ricciae]